jgi:CMP/dCMP kinase
MNKIITISRQYGSGGREIGSKLAKRLGIPFYDNELIARAAKESGFAEAAFENAEKKATNSLLYSIAMGMNAYGNQDLGFTHLSLDDQIYLAQSNVIRKVAAEGPCVIVGRCADYILKDLANVVNIFIWADLECRKNRAINQYHLPRNKAEEEILKMDKRRANYYNYHANDKWGKAENYHLSIKSDYVGIDNAVDCIVCFLECGERGK